MLKFSLTWTLHFLYSVFAVRSLALDYAEGGARRGVMAAPWITGSGSVAFCMVKRLKTYILSFGIFFFFPFPEDCGSVAQGLPDSCPERPGGVQ